MILLRFATSLLYTLLAALTFVWAALAFDFEMIAIPVTEFCSHIADRLYTGLVEMPESTNILAEE